MMVFSDKQKLTITNSLRKTAVNETDSFVSNLGATFYEVRAPQGHFQPSCRICQVDDVVISPLLPSNKKKHLVPNLKFVSQG